MGRSRFATFAWIVLIYNVAVIIWGAFVRTSLSGDGCGSHWPLCNGAIVPPALSFKTLVEYSHRLMTGIDGFLVLALLILAFRLFPKGSAVRPAAVVSFVFLMIEALIGAALVKFQWVTTNDSAARAIMQAVHLTNTFFLLAGLALTALYAGGVQPPRLKGQGPLLWALGAAVFGCLALGISGAVTALGDLLYPVRSSVESIEQSLNPTAHFLVRLRVLHPLIATSVGLLLILVGGLVIHLRPSPAVRTAVRWTCGLFMAQMALGLVNVFLKAPVPMQLAHLALADAIWVALIAAAAYAVAIDVPRVEMASTSTNPVRATWRDYVQLTKPRVISLLLFTTLAAAVIAAGGWPGLSLFLALAIGGYMAAGAANTINMVLERDLDVRMKRTAVRPTVTERIPAGSALRFGFILAAGSFAILWGFANLLAAMLSLAGLVFYVIVYTMVLKRRTWQNIVIGGAAGAFPPLVGWAAVTGELSPLAWMLFAVVFVWTPVHFWALALLIKDDYARAGVPMLPVVHGDRVTVIQICLYAMLTVVVTLLPLAHNLGNLGALYMWGSIALNLVLLVRCVQLWQHTDRPHAVTLYKYSMVYLFLLFVVCAVDRAGVV